MLQPGLATPARRRRDGPAAIATQFPLQCHCRRNLSQRVAGYSKKLTSEGDALSDEVGTGGSGTSTRPPRPGAVHAGLVILGRSALARTPLRDAAVLGGRLARAHALVPCACRCRSCPRTLSACWSAPPRSWPPPRPPTGWTCCRRWRARAASSGAAAPAATCEPRRPHVLAGWLSTAFCSWLGRHLRAYPFNCPSACCWHLFLPAGANSATPGSRPSCSCCWAPAATWCPFARWAAMRGRADVTHPMLLSPLLIAAWQLTWRVPPLPAWRAAGSEHQAEGGVPPLPQPLRRGRQPGAQCPCSDLLVFAPLPCPLRWRVEMYFGL